MCFLRKAKQGDEKAIFEMVKSVLNKYGISTNADKTDKDLSDINKYYFHNKGWFEVLIDDETIIGSYGIFHITDSICELRKMYLLPEYQGKGLGKMMMNASLQKARELDYIQMILESNKLLDRALELYKKFGFMEYVPDHFSDRCDLAMKLTL